MGRWGHRKLQLSPSIHPNTGLSKGLFEGDTGLDILDSVHVEILEKLKAKAITVPDSQLAAMLLNKEDVIFQPTPSSMPS